MTREAERAVEQDCLHIIHPNGPLAFAQADAPRLIVSGDGVRLRDADGVEFIDALSGLVCVNVGYGRRELAAAASAAAHLGFGTLFFGRTNLFAAELSATLARVTPGDIGRFFFTQSGSDANDTAFRLARMLHVAEGAPQKVKIICRAGSYHGATLATLSAGGDPRRHAGLGIRMPGFVDVSQPRPGFDAIGELRRVIQAEGPETIAAFIGEPIAYQAGMIVPPADYWPEVRALCDEFDILLIVDEVLTGFGRTGRMFAMDHWEVVPDLLTISKGLTSGYLPLGAVGLRSPIFDRLQAALDSHEGVLGFTNTGHPASCAVASANLKIIEDEDLVTRSAEMGAYLDSLLRDAATATAHIAGHRVVGLLAGVDVSPGGECDDVARATFCKIVVAQMAQRGVFVRQFGQTVAIAPPLVVTEPDLEEIVRTLGLALVSADR